MQGKRKENKKERKKNGSREERKEGLVKGKEGEITEGGRERTKEWKWGGKVYGQRD